MRQGATIVGIAFDLCLLLAAYECWHHRMRDRDLQAQVIYVGEHKTNERATELSHSGPQGTDLEACEPDTWSLGGIGQQTEAQRARISPFLGCYPLHRTGLQVNMRNSNSAGIAARPSAKRHVAKYGDKRCALPTSWDIGSCQEVSLSRLLILRNHALNQWPRLCFWSMDFSFSASQVSHAAHVALHRIQVLNLLGASAHVATCCRHCLLAVG